MDIAFISPQSKALKVYRAWLAEIVRSKEKRKDLSSCPCQYCSVRLTEKQNKTKTKTKQQRPPQN
jgi:hypothetical protein